MSEGMFYPQDGAAQVRAATSTKGSFDAPAFERAGEHAYALLAAGRNLVSVVMSPDGSASVFIERYPLPDAPEQWPLLQVATITLDPAGKIKVSRKQA